MTWPALPADLGTPPASEAGQLAEVVVTANRLGAQNLQTVPTSITSLDTATLDREGLQTLSDMTLGTPGISIAETGAGQNTVVIRGIVTIGAPDPTNVENQTPVSVYLDDTPISLTGATPDLRVFDLERVEIVRGPQGTLYGAGAMAGNIRYITKKADATQYDAMVEASGLDTRDGGVGFSARAMLNVPLIDHALALRISAYQGEDPGWIKNIAMAGNDYSNEQRNTQLHAGVRFDDQGPLVVDASFLYGNVNRGANNAIYADLPGYEYSATSPQSYVDRFGISNLTTELHLPRARLISSTSYVARDITDWSSAEVAAAYFLGYNTLSRGYYSNDIHDFTEEIRLASMDWTRVHGQIGLFYEDQHRTYTQDLPTVGADAQIAKLYGAPGSLALGAFQANDIFSEYQVPKTQQLAEFAEVTYSPTDSLDLTVGARHFYWRQSFYLYSAGLFGVNPATLLPLTTNQSSTESGVNPKVNVAYHFNPDSMVFIEAAKGFRYGGINQPVPLALCTADLASYGLTTSPLTYGPDYLWTYSLGEKSTLADHRLLINATAFFTHWFDVQTEAILPTCGYYFEQNKGAVKSDGLELESRWIATSNLSFALSASFTDAKADGRIENLGALDGARAPYFPRVIASLQSDYTRAISIGDLRIHADFTWRSDQVTSFDPADTLVFREIPGTHVLNAALTLKQDSMEYTIYARNLTNDRIISLIAPNLYSSAQPYGDIDYVAPPLTVGIRATWHLH